MKHRNLILLLCTWLLLLFTACGSDNVEVTPEELAATPVEIVEATEVAQAENTPTLTAQPPTEVPASPTFTAVPPTATATELPTETPTAEPVASNCLVCHSDQQMLTSLAAPAPAPEESESSGVG